MQTRRLGERGPEVSAIGLGCMSIADSYDKTDERTGAATIHRALELGITFLDTADIYGPLTNEPIVGRAISGRRERVVVATKFGFVIHDNGDFEIVGRPEYVRAACEASLRRL